MDVPSEYAGKAIEVFGSAGGEMAEEDMDELMLAIQEAYVDAKRRNKKYAPKKYQQQP